MSPQTDLEALVERLRDRVVGALHVGRVRAGDRLPGVREIARETGANPRTVAKAYRELAACVDGIEDHRRALCEELEQAFGISCVPLRADDLPEEHTAEPAYPAALRNVDLVVTTPFHAAPARRVAELPEKPLVVVTLHPDLASAIEQRLQEDNLTVVCVDPAFGEQVRTLYGGESPDRIRMVTTGDEPGLASLDPEDPVLLTRAAQERLGDASPTPIAPLSPFISPESARQVAELMIRLHVEAEHTSHGDRSITGPQ
jgi:AcrR family transcriptional regulator